MKQGLKFVLFLIGSLFFFFSCEESGGLLFEEVKQGEEVLKYGKVSGGVLKPCTPPTSKIVINEFMGDPLNISDENGEWVELYNPNAEAINLKGWKLKDNGNDNHIIGPDLIVAKGGYVVLCRNNDKTQNGGVICDYKYDNFQLTNTADTIILQDEKGNLIDTVTWTQALPTGQTLALKNPYYDNKFTYYFGWAASLSTYGTAGERGTPGAKNSDVYKLVEVKECSDNDKCTYDLCEVGICDNTQKKPNCCYTNDDCKDDNPCNKDFCFYGVCRFTDYSVVPNCCMKDTDCNDNKPCTKDTCNLQTHKCTFTPIGEGCCVFNYDCNDNNFCTIDYCIENKCSHVLKKNCCTKHTDCDDNILCTEDKCVFNVCRHFQILDGKCCVADKDCPDDGNPCTAHKCVNGFCETSVVELCKVTLPFIETFDKAPTLESVGWKAINLATCGNEQCNAISNWKLDVEGTMGPDKFVKFDWSPTKINVKTVLASPQMDTSPALKHTPKKVTVQFEYSYKHPEGGSGTSTFKLVATEKGDFNNPVVLWEKILDKDIEYEFINVGLPDALTGVKTLRIGFMIETSSTFNLDKLEIDKVKVGIGVPPEYIVELSQLGDVVMKVCEYKKLKIAIKDVDLKTAPYIQFPELSFYGKPLDAPSFIYWDPTIEWDFVNKRFFAYLHIKPNCIKANSGVYEIGLVAQEGKKLGGILEVIKKMKVYVLLDKGYLVWSPLGENHPSAVSIKKEIAENGRDVQVLEDILLYKDLKNLSGIFVTLGVYGEKRVIKVQEADALKTYLNGGGKLYLEGGDFFYTDPPTSLHPLFNIKGLSEGETKTDGPEIGVHFLYGYEFNYSQEAKLNAFIDKIDRIMGTDSRVILRNKGAKTYGVVVASVGKNYRTIGSSILFGGLQKKSDKTLKELMGKYIYFLENGWPKCSSYHQCDDLDICTADSCENEVCKNVAPPECKICSDDRDCSANEACKLQVEGNLCVDIIGKEFPSGDINTNFGSNPPKVEHVINVGDEGNVEDINVKVKIAHAYRGDVRITLKHAGISVVLKQEDANDSKKDIYMTYDLGVSSAQSLDLFNGGPVKGEWRIVVEDTNPPLSNGIFYSWTIFAKFSIKTCSQNLDCNDNNICTDDSCIGGQCKNTIKSCDDGNVCTIDSCDSKTGCVNVNNDQASQKCYPCGKGTPNVGICKYGTQVCVNKAWGPCIGYVCPDTQEYCDNVDNDCDGTNNEGFNDGLSCDGADSDFCKNGTYTCTKDRLGTECINEKITDIPEKCGDNIDNDCDGLINEEGAQGCEIYYLDGDNDTYGNETATKCLCQAEGKYTIKHQTGMKYDCNDADAEVNPGFKEKCDNKDNDCDGIIDEENATNCVPFYYDGDKDGHGINVSKCLCKGDGFYTSDKNDDCKDDDFSIYPGAAEKCDGIDQNCNNEIDEGCPPTQINFITPSGVFSSDTVNAGLSECSGSNCKLKAAVGQEGIVGISTGKEGTACDGKPCEIIWGFFPTTYAPGE